MLDRGKFPAGEFGAEDIERDSVARDRVPDLVQRLDEQRTGAEQILREPLKFWVAPVRFGVWKFPQMGVDRTGRPAPDQEAAFFFHDERGKTTPGRGDAPAEVGELVRTVFAERDAMLSQRAQVTFWLARSADHGAQFHQGLVEM